MKKNVLITGVSSGIGLATLKEYLKDSHNQVIGLLRNPEVLKDLASLHSNLLLYKIDFVNLNEILQVVDFLKSHNVNKIDLLVNNAGVATAAPFEYQDFTEIQNIITVNVLAVMRLTQVLIPFLKKSSEAVIVNISSVSGVGGTPFLATYCASKHAIEGLSESLRRELNIYAIKVRVVGPGSVKTPIWQKGFQKIATKYSQTEFSEAFSRFIKFASSEEKHGLDETIIVQEIVKAANFNSCKIRYAPVPRKLMNWYIPMFIPKFVYDRMMTKALKLVRISKNETDNKL